MPEATHSSARHAGSAHAGWQSLALALARCVDEGLLGPGIDSLTELSRQERENSIVVHFEGVGAGTPRRYYAKWFRPRGATSADAEQARSRLNADFEMARRVHAALGTGALGVVWPVAVLPDLLVTVTAEAPGLPLSVMLERGLRWPERDSLRGPTLAALERVGQWLSAFQALTPSPGRFSLEGMRAYLDARLRRLAAQPRARFGPDKGRAVLAWFDAMASQVDPGDLDEVVLHADLSPSNVLVDADRIVVIDFATAASGGRYHDVARMFTQLEFLTAKPQFRRRAVVQAQSALLAGFDQRLVPEVPLFRLFCVQHVVCHLLSTARQPGRFPASLYSAYQRRAHRHWLAEAIGVTRRQP